MRPCDCKCEDDLKNLDHHGIATNGEGIEVIGNHVKITVYRTEIIVGVSQFKQWAEWFLKDQSEVQDSEEYVGRTERYPKLYNYLCTVKGITEKERNKCLGDFTSANEEHVEMEDKSDIFSSFLWERMPSGGDFWSDIEYKIRKASMGK